MDQGIIQAVKLKYRKRQLQHVLCEMDRHPVKTGPQILKEITVLQAINWVYRAWSNTEQSTIHKCFNVAGFSVLASDSESDSESSALSDLHIDEDNFPLAVVKMARELFDCEVSDLVNIDAMFATCDNDMSEWDKPASKLLEDTCNTTETLEDEEPTNDSVNVVSMDDASDCIDKLRSFALQIGNNDMFRCVMDFDDLLVGMQVATTTQTRIDDFFKKRVGQE